MHSVVKTKRVNLKNCGVREAFFVVSNAPFLCSLFPLGGGYLHVRLVLFSGSYDDKLQELDHGPLCWLGAHLHLSMNVLVLCSSH